MAARLDINILSFKSIELHDIIKLVDAEFGVSLKVKEIEILDNWTYQNIEYETKSADVKKHIDAGRVANILFDDLECQTGCQLEKIGDTYFTNFWFDTQKFPNLDSDFITEENSQFYNKLLCVFLNISKDFKIIASSVGVESEVQQYHNLIDIIKESKNVNMWFVKGIFFATIPKYQTEVCDKATVLRKIFSEN